MRDWCPSINNTWSLLIASQLHHLCNGLLIDCDKIPADRHVVLTGNRGCLNTELTGITNAFNKRKTLACGKQ